MGTKFGHIEVRFAAAAAAGPADAVVVAAGGRPPHWVARTEVAPAGGGWHGGGCVCCLPRAPGRDALLRLFHARVRGEGPAFDRVVVDLPADAAAVLRAALANDAFLAARFLEVEP
jgi:hypothetical protein